jgi:hypothetical protein
MQLGNANLGGGARAAVVTKAKSQHRWSRRVWERWWVSRDATCGNANLGDEGDEGKEPPPLEPRVGAGWWVSRCREMQLGDAKLGDKGQG